MFELLQLAPIAIITDMEKAGLRMLARYHGHYTALASSRSITGEPESRKIKKLALGLAMLDEILHIEVEI